MLIGTEAMWNDGQAGGALAKAITARCAPLYPAMTPTSPMVTALMMDARLAGLSGRGGSKRTWGSIDCPAIEVKGEGA